jgi:superfamily II DNA/RNA helicase
LTPTFHGLGVPEDLCHALRKAGIGMPFPVQAATLPDALAGHDLCGRAPTGSGKTLAFGIPLVARVQPARPHRPTGLVLVPTRELALQVQQALILLARARKQYVLAVYGGAAMQPQLDALRRGASIVVATPGRLIDLLERTAIDLGAVEVAVIDEADRMADMGFLPQVRAILDQTPASRQTMLWSATLDGDVDTLIRTYQRTPVRHELAPEPGAECDVAHHFWHVDKVARVGTAAGLVRAHGTAVVFCRTRHGADRVAKQLADAGVASAAIHGSRTQAQRERALQAFKRGEVAALVATDVAARGIHVDGVGVVVHWDPPADHKDYVHRSGRTGRAGATGVVVSLVLPEVRSATMGLQRALSLPTGTTQPDPAMLAAASRAASAPARQDAAVTSARSGAPGAARPRPRPDSPKARAAERSRNDTSAAAGSRNRYERRRAQFGEPADRGGARPSGSRGRRTR